MSKISLRIADLRKKKRVTQQELADSIGVSFQTISKWETGINMPDIAVLPLLAEYFSVSTDQLLGLKPLDICQAVLRHLDNPTAGYTFVKGKMISYGKKPEISDRFLKTSD